MSTHQPCFAPDPSSLTSCFLQTHLQLMKHKLPRVWPFTASSSPLLDCLVSCKCRQLSWIIGWTLFKRRLTLIEFFTAFQSPYGSHISSGPWGSKHAIVPGLFHSRVSHTLPSRLCWLGLLFLINSTNHIHTEWWRPTFSLRLGILLIIRYWWLVWCMLAPASYGSVYVSKICWSMIYVA